MNKIFAFLLIFVAVLERVVWDLGPNLELVTWALVLASLYLPKKFAAIVALLALALSDLIIGNSMIFVFTWSGFVLPALVLPYINSFKNKSGWVKSLAATASGLGTNLFFFVWTNFGVWLTDSWGMYDNNAFGLLHSYINGLPFLKYSVFSTFLVIPVSVLLIEIALSQAKKISFSTIAKQYI